MAKKFKPLDTRDFVPFGDYDELNIENIKDACERFYKAPIGSCDILASDRGPSRTRLEQLKGKKYYHIQFLPPGDVVGVERKRSAASEPASPPKRKRCANPLKTKHLSPNRFHSVTSSEQENSSNRNRRCCCTSSNLM